MSLEEDIEYTEELEINEFNSFLKYLDNLKSPKQYQNIFIHLNTPVTLTYINNKDCNPICNKNDLILKNNLIKLVAKYHTEEKMDFYCEINQNKKIQKPKIKMFANYLIQLQNNMFQNSSIIIPNPKIIISSQDNIAFPTLYDERTFTLENLTFDRKIFVYDNPDKKKV